MKTFECVWRAKWSCDGATTIPEMVEKLKQQTEYLEKLHRAGVTLRDPVKDDWAFLETDDAEVAQRFGFWRPENDG